MNKILKRYKIKFKKYFKHNFNFKNSLPKIANLALPIFLGIAGITFASTVGTNITTVGLTTSGNVLIGGTLNLTGLATFLNGIVVTGNNFQKDSDGNITKITIAPNTSITDYANVLTTGSIAWAQAQLTGGGEIELTCGSFPIDQELTLSTDKISIKGKGKCTRIYAVDGATHGEFKGIHITSDDVILKDFDLDGDGDTTTYREISYAVEVGGKRARIEGLEIHDQYVDGIVAMANSDGGIAMNNYIHDLKANPNDQVSALESEDGARDFTFQGNYVENAYGCMFPHVHLNICGGGSDPCGPVFNIKHIDNICIAGANTTYGGSTGILDEANGASYVVFEGNYMDGYGIGMSTISGGSSRIVFNNNRIDNATGVGLSVNSGYMEATNNKILGWGTIGIQSIGATTTINNNIIKDTDNTNDAISCESSNCKISGNDITSAVGSNFYGIYATVSGATKEVSISDNNITAGIYINPITSGIFSNVLIQNNIVGKTIFSYPNGGLIDYISILGNSVNGGDARGIDITATAGNISDNEIINAYSSTAASYGLSTSITKSIISNNTIKSVLASGGAYDSYGLVVSGNRNNIHHNYIDTISSAEGKQAYGVYITGDYNYLNNNTIHDVSYFLRLPMGADQNKIILNNFNIGILDNYGFSNVFRSNLGFVTENEGVVSGYTCGNTIAHGLSSTPDYVIITPESAAIGAYVDTADFTTTTFKIQCTSGIDFYWRAVYQP